MDRSSSPTQDFRDWGYTEVIIELVIVGSEILSGQTVNTNLAYIGKQLEGAGYSLSRETVLQDNLETLLSGFKEALARSDLVIAVGGLGPTLDDLTRQALATVYGCGFRLEKKVVNNLETRFGKDFATLRDQATVPECARILLNPVGTAPGLICEGEVGTLIALPGVPNEMRPLFADQVLPYIVEQFPLKAKVFKKALHFFELPEHAIDAVLRTLKERYPSVDFGIYPMLGVVSVTLSFFAEDREQAEDALTPPYYELERHFASNCFDSPTGLLEEAVHHLFIDKEWTLSCAESCTGGILSSRLTHLAGSSRYFLGSVVPYSNELKTALLAIPEELIKEKGSVSREVVEKMAEGMLKLSGSDFALAISGVAGPSGGTPEQPVGTVWCVVAHRAAPPHTWKLQISKPRHLVIERSVNSLLANLLMYTKSFNV